MTGALARYDWYEATFVTLEPEQVVRRLAAAIGGEVTTGKGRYGYALCSAIDREGRVIARVFTRSKTPGEVHLAVTGESCDEVVPLVREWWPDHRVSRCDVAVDWCTDFELLDERVQKFAEDRGMKHSLFTSSDGGATRYIGSKKSEMFARVYKKSEELRSKYPDQADEVPDGIVRAEIVVRPKSRNKAALASLPPEAVYGLSKWGKAFAAEFADIDAERIKVSFTQVSDWERIRDTLFAQYGPSVRRRAELVGVEQARAELLEVFCL